MSRLARRCCAASATSSDAPHAVQSAMEPSRPRALPDRRPDAQDQGRSRTLGPDRPRPSQPELVAPGLASSHAASPSPGLGEVDIELADGEKRLRVSTATTSSAIPRSASTVCAGATGTATTTRRAPRPRSAWIATRAVKPGHGERAQTRRPATARRRAGASDPGRPSNRFPQGIVSDRPTRPSS